MSLALVLSACGGGSGSSGDGDPASEYGDQAGEEEAVAPATEDPNAVSDLTRKRRAATFKVSYEWTSGKRAEANETWYQKPPKSRVDFGDASDHQRMAQFILDAGVFVCQTTDHKANCWKADGTDAKAPEELSFTAAIMTVYEGLLSEPAFGATRSGRTIVGQRASCATATNILLLGLAEITLCHASNGVPLLLEWKTNEETVRMEATNYTTIVSDEDFELLATPDEDR